jgi:hypothetical protein
MRVSSRKLALTLLLLAAWPLSSGCVAETIRYWQSMVHFPGYNPGGGYLQGEPEDGQQVIVQDAGDTVTVTLEAEMRVARCQLDAALTSGRCLYNLAGGPISSTFTVRDNRVGQSPQGLQLSAIELNDDDPIILQVPADASVDIATFQVGTASRPLVVTVAPSFETGPGSTVLAEPGKTFLIVELPADVIENIGTTDPAEGPEFSFTLQYTSGDIAASSFKAMMSLKVVEEDHSYYLPLLPCVADFSQIPATDLPGSLTPTSLLPALASLLKATSGRPCQGQLYDLRTIPAGGKVFLPSLTSEH